MQPQDSNANEEPGSPNQRQWTQNGYMPWMSTRRQQLTPTAYNHEESRSAQSVVDSEQVSWFGWHQHMVNHASPLLMYHSPFTGATYHHSPPQTSPYMHNNQDGLHNNMFPDGGATSQSAWQYYGGVPTPAISDQATTGELLATCQPYLYSQSSPTYADAQGDDYNISTYTSYTGFDPSLQFPTDGVSIPPATTAGPRNREDTLAAQRYLPAILIWEKCISEDVASCHEGCGSVIRDFLARYTDSLAPLIRSQLPGLAAKDKDILPSSLTPFGHPLMQLVVPPPSMRFIPPSVTDASLYCLRVPNAKQANPQQRFRLSATGDPGFENSVTADWLIALVALLYYSLPPLRISIARHYCTEPVCWVCELSFVFRSLDVSKQEGKAQPVRIASFAEALFRAGPIMTLGLHEASSMEIDFRDSNITATKKDIEDSRVAHRVRESLGLKSSTPSWLRHSSPYVKASQGPPEMSAEDISGLASRAQRRRNRVARAVRRNEAEKRKGRYQEHHRSRLHYRCHQVLNYLLHSFLKLPPQCPNPLFEMTEDREEFPELQSKVKRVVTPPTKTEEKHTKNTPGALFSFKVESVTECKRGESTKANELVLLELDHSQWANLKSKEIETPSIDSHPISTSSSFLQSSSRPTSSGVSSVSSSSSLAEAPPLPTTVSDTYVRAASSPITMTDKTPTFCRLLQQSLCKSQSVPMICSLCDSSCSSRHIVRHKVISLPPVLSIKIKLDSSTSGESQPLRFWRLNFNPSSLTPRTVYSHGVKAGGVADDDADISRLIARYLKQRSESLTEREVTAASDKKRQTKHLASMLDAACDASASPLPATLYVYQTAEASSPNPWSVSADPPPPTVPLCSCSQIRCEKCHRYDLTGVLASINFTWNRARKKLAWLNWTDDLAPRLGVKRQTNCKRAGRILSILASRKDLPDLTMAERERLIQRIEAEEAMVEAPPDEDHMVCFVRCPTKSQQWLFLNGPVVASTTLDEARRFGYTWKYPVAVFYSRLPVIWESAYLNAVPPAPPPLPSAEELFRNESISQVPMARRKHPRFAPLSTRELDVINQGGGLVALDAEHVVLRMLDKSPTSIAPSHAQLALGRLSACRADGREFDTLPFLDHYLHFRDEPLDYRTRFSGLYPGDLDVAGSVHWLATHKQIYQIMRYLVEKKCRFIGHDLFNDFRVIGIVVSQNQIIDTVEIYRPNIHSRFLSLKFLCYYVLNIDIQDQTHDSIEDAQAALALYRYYLEYVEKESLEKFQKDKLNELYTIGFATQFKILREPSDRFREAFGVMSTNPNS